MIKFIIAGAAALALLTGCGSETQASPESPSACLDALDYADEGFLLSAEIMYAIEVGDFYETERLLGEFEALTPLYLASKQQCRDLEGGLGEPT